MAFISSCPKCQKPVLVPEGCAHDAQVQCPACYADYALGEILAAVPALIVVHPGSSTAAAEQEPIEGGVFAAHRVERTLHDTDALDFVSEAAPVVASAERPVEFGEHVEHSSADALFAAAVASETPADEPGLVPFADPTAVPLEGYGEPVVGEAKNEDDWGANWGGFGEQPAEPEGEEGAIGLAEAEESGEGDLAQVNFAEITGKPQPSMAAAGDAATVAFEPPKKKKRKRETNPVVRFVGIVFSGLLAVVCVLGFAMWRGMQFEFLPSWLQFGSHKTASQNTGPKPNVQTPAPVKTEAAANPNPTGSEPPKTANEDDKLLPNTAPGSETNATAKPDKEEPNGQVAAGKQPGGKPDAPGGEMPGKEEEPDNENGFATGGDDEPPSLGKPDKTVPEGPIDVAPVGPKPKETANAAPVPIVPATPVRPETPKKPDEGDPFSANPVAPPSTDKPKDEPKLEVPALAKPEVAPKPEKPKTPEESAKPETVAKPPLTPPTIEKPNFAPPGSPIPEKPALPNVETPPLTKPEMEKPAAKLETKPAPLLAPLGAPSIPAAKLDATLTRAGGAEPAYGDLCDLAETATFAQNPSEKQKQSVENLAKKLAGNPQAVAQLAADAKKQLDGSPTKGGIVLTGKVSGAASKNGLFGTAIRVEGMAKAVMVFSAHPLGVKESQTVVVFGSLVGDPAKNLPGYPGKAPVVVWAEFAAAAQ